MRAEIVDDDLLRRVAEAHVVEGDLAADALRGGGMRGRGLLLGLVQELKDALGGGHGALQDVEDLRDLRNRLVEAAHVLDEALDVAHGDHARGGVSAAQHHRGDVAEVSDEGGDGLHQAAQKLGFPGRAVQLFIHPGEGALGALLRAEGLHHHVPGVHLLDLPVELAHVALLPHEVFLALSDHQPHEDAAQRQNEQRRERHLPADGQHHHRHAHRRGQRADHLRQALVEALAEGIDVVGHAAEHVAVGHAVEVAHGQAVHLGGQPPAQAVGELLAHARHDEVLREAQRRAHHVQAQQPQKQHADAPVVDARPAAETADQPGENLRRHLAHLPGPDDGKRRAAHAQHRHRDQA